MQTGNTEYFINVERVEAVAGNLEAWLGSLAEPPIEQMAANSP